MYLWAINQAVSWKSSSVMLILNAAAQTPHSISIDSIGSVFPEEVLSEPWVSLEGIQQ